MHVAVRAVIRDHTVPSANLQIRSRVDERKPVIAEEPDRPLPLPAVVFDQIARVHAFTYNIHSDGIQRLIVLPVLARLRDRIHMGPEVVGEVMIDRFGEVQVLQLRKRLQARGRHHMDAQDGREAVVVEVERVLARQPTAPVRVKRARVFHHVYVPRRPAGGDVAHHDLLQERPVAREADVQAGVLRDVGVRGPVPCGDGGQVCGCLCAGGEREVFG